MKKNILLFTLLFQIICLAQSGSWDSTFNVGTGPGPQGSIFHAAIMPDGKIVVVGSFTLFNGSQARRIVRLNADGSVDSSFNNSGTGFDAGWGAGGYNVSTVVAQPDGKILVAGNFANYNGVPVSVVARINTDGSLDNSFVYNYNLSHSTVSSILVQPDGKIILGGRFFSWLNVGIFEVLVRLNPDGSIDPTFTKGIATNNMLVTNIGDMKFTVDGKIYVAGSFTNFNNAWYPNLVRLNSDGTVDTSFLIYNGFNGRVKHIDVTPDGGIFASGTFTTYGLLPCSKLIKILPYGYRDFSFVTPDEIVFNGGYNNFLLQPNGKILAFAQVMINGIWKYNLGMLNPDGSTDNTFLNAFPDYVQGGFLQPDNKIVCWGHFWTYGGNQASRIVRLNGVTLSNPDFQKNSLTVFPNPVSDLLKIKTTDNLMPDQLMVIDLTGKIILVQTQNTNELDVKSMANGLYILQANIERINTKPNS